MAERDVKDLVRHYFDAVNGEQWDDVVALFHEDAVLYVPSVRPKHGKEPIRRFYEDIGARFGSHRTEVVFLISEGSRAAATVRYVAVDAAGDSVGTYATDTFTYDGARIRELRVVFDTADFQGGDRR